MLQPGNLLNLGGNDRTRVLGGKSGMTIWTIPRQRPNGALLPARPVARAHLLPPPPPAAQAHRLLQPPSPRLRLPQPCPHGSRATKKSKQTNARTLPAHLFPRPGYANEAASAPEAHEAHAMQPLLSRAVYQAVRCPPVQLALLSTRLVPSRAAMQCGTFPIRATARPSLSTLSLVAASE